MRYVNRYVMVLLIVMVVLLSRPSNGLTCHSCSSCNDSFNTNNIPQVTVPDNQGYYCRKSSILTIVDRDASQWCVQGDIKGNGLWCCQTNLCNGANIVASTSFLILSVAVTFVFN